MTDDNKNKQNKSDKNKSDSDKLNKSDKRARARNAPAPPFRWGQIQQRWHCAKTTGTTQAACGAQFAELPKAELYPLEPGLDICIDCTRAISSRGE